MFEQLYSYAQNQNNKEDAGKSSHWSVTFPMKKVGTTHFLSLSARAVPHAQGNNHQRARFITVLYFMTVLYTSASK
jgi:hypothetical protein